MSEEDLLKLDQDEQEDDWDTLGAPYCGGKDEECEACQ